MNRWRRMAEDMKRHGMSVNRQAVEVELSVSTYFSRLEGAKPPFEDALEVIALHAMVCGPSLTRERLGDELMAKIAMLAEAST